MEFAPLLLAFVGITMGGFLKGATGAGAPVVGVPILAIVFDVPMAVAIFSVLNLFSNIWQSWAFRDAVTDWRFVWVMSATGAVGAVLGSILLATLPTEILMAALALIVFAYIALRLSRPGWQLARATGQKLAPAAGFVGGFMQGAGGLSAPVSVTFLNSLNLTRREFIGTISVFFIAMSVFQIPVLAALGILDWQRAALGIAAMLPLFIGIYVGSWSARYLSKEAFDKAILVLLAVIAVKLLWDVIA